ncbi:MAG: transcriptional repressor NrdR [Desulfamplus sp.]|nr:transcriptional repressor NrdR [Desulfamplus sp.]
MKCPFCGKMNNRVIDSRLSRTEMEIRRRRECQECSRRFTTFEIMEDLPVTIVKKDGRREEFIRDKVLTGIKKACEKRAISMIQIEELVDTIERDLRDLNAKEISSKLVGEKIMEHLHMLDDVAYVRFASVYREFGSVDDFIEALKKLSTLNKQAGNELYETQNDTQNRIDNTQIDDEELDTDNIDSGEPTTGESTTREQENSKESTEHSIIKNPANEQPTSEV